MDHIDTAHHKLDAKITNLEHRTRSHIQHLSDTVKQKLAHEKEECRQRTERSRQSKIDEAEARVLELQRWVEQRLASIEPEPNSSIYSRDISTRRSLKKPKDPLSSLPPLTRSRSEEAISELHEQVQIPGEPMYKGLRVLDHPTSMYNIPQKVIEDEKIVIYDSPKPLKNLLPSALQNLTPPNSRSPSPRFRNWSQSATDLSCTNSPKSMDVSTKSELSSNSIGEKQKSKDIKGNSQFENKRTVIEHLNYELMKDNATKTSRGATASNYDSPKPLNGRNIFSSSSSHLSVMNGNIHTQQPEYTAVLQRSKSKPNINTEDYHGQHHYNQNTDDYYRRYPYNNQNGVLRTVGTHFNAQQAEMNSHPHLFKPPSAQFSHQSPEWNVNRNFSYQSNVPNVNGDFRHNVQQQHQMNSEIRNNVHHYQQAPKDPSRSAYLDDGFIDFPEVETYHAQLAEAHDDLDSETYLDMDSRQSIQAAVRRLYDGYHLTAEGKTAPAVYRQLLESSVEQDPHNDSGYSTRPATTSQGPSPALSGEHGGNEAFNLALHQFESPKSAKELQNDCTNLNGVSVAVPTYNRTAKLSHQNTNFNSEFIGESS
ncbi:unnamed protein product, partial [Meganyctiphanes norvegica]